MFMNTASLKMFFDAQKSVTYGGSGSMNKYILAQSQDVLQGLADGSVEINASDIDLCIELARCYAKSVSGENRKMALDLLRKILAVGRKRQDILQKMENIHHVAYVLNHKKLAAQLSPEEMMVMSNTILQDKQNSPKFNQRLMQQLNSRALWKYASMSDKEICDSKINQNFVQMFGLKHKSKSRHNNGNFRTITNAVLAQEPVVKKKSFRTITNAVLAQEPVVKKKSFMTRCAEKIKNFKYNISTSLTKLKHKVAHFYRQHEYKIAAFSFFLIGVGTYKASNYLEKEQTKAAYNQIQSSYTHDDAKSADFSAERAKIMNAQKNDTQNKTEATVVDHSMRDYYDTALLIHLKSVQAVQKLYHKIDSLAASGAIHFSQGTNAKRYAHAFTMYELIRPNSDENKKIQKLLAGEKVDAEYINSLVLKAGPKGNGVKPDNSSIKTSHFDQATKSLKLAHLANLKSVSR